MSKHLTIALSLLTAFACTMAAVSQAAEMPATLRAGPTNLILNGTGVRTKGPFQLYLAGLYLVRKNSEPVEIMTANDPMALRLQIVSRMVSQTKMIRSLNEGFQQSAGGELAALEDQIRQFRVFFNEKISRGDVFEMVYVPNIGTIVSKNGTKKGVIEGVRFKKALFGIWLSDQPCDAHLKRDLLASQSNSSIAGTAARDTK